MPSTLARRPASNKNRTKKPVRSDSPRRDERHGGIGSAAVAKATGKNWREWFALMDRGGCAAMDHRQIVAFLNSRHNVGPWWQQMITVGYEQARGRRLRHQRPDGYEISANKTLNVSATVAYMWWSIHKCRAKWLGDLDIAIHKKTPSKSLRITWNASGSTPVKSIAVGLYPRGQDRTVMSIQHGRLASAADARKMKSFWTARLGRLEQLIAERSRGR